MWYKIDITDNIITVRNLSSEGGIAVSIYVATDVDSTYKQVVDTYRVDFEETKKLPLIDGIYKIKLERLSGNTVIETVEDIYPYYGMLIRSIIQEMEYFLCGCGCNTCDDCGKDEKLSLSVVLKAFSYYTLMYKFYPKFYDAVFKCINYSIQEINTCILIDEKVTGNAQKEDLFRKIISAFYLAFYFAEFYSASDTEVINKKFKYSKLIKCIKINNTDINCITNNIDNNMGLFSIQFGQYVNKAPDVVGDYSTSAANRAVVTLTPGMFTTLTVPAYHDPEGDAAQAIRIDSLATNSAVLTYNNNPVTVGQIITIADIASNMLKITGPNQNAIANSSFNFSVRDAGSMQFSS